MRFYEMYFVRNDEIKMLNQSVKWLSDWNRTMWLFDYGVALVA